MQKDNADLRALSDRIVRLERRQRRAVAALAAVVAAVAVALAVPFSQAQNPTQPRTVTEVTDAVLHAEQLVISDAAGKARLALGVTEGIGPTLLMYDQAGTAQVMLALSGAGPVLNLFDAGGRDRLRLAITDSIGPSLVLKDAQENPRAALAVVAEKPSLQLLNTEGAAVWRTP
jgi:hypothetical protein